MSWSFVEVGMTRPVIERGIDAMRGRSFNKSEWSGKVYLVDPRDDRLWDLKIALRVAAEEAGIELYPSFTSDRYRKDLLKLGVSYVKFSRDAKRLLGVCGNDLSEHLDEHELFMPDGRVFPMGASTFGAEDLMKPVESRDAEEESLAYETRVRRWHLRYERRVGNGRFVKERLGLTCQGCGLDAAVSFGRDMAMSCMEAHHLVPVAKIPPEGRKVRLSDFAVLCATCHRLIHRLASPDDLDGLRELAERRKTT